MASFSPDINDLPVPLLSLLSEQAVEEGLPRLLKHLLGAFRVIGSTMRDGGYSSSHVGTTNVFGDQQLDVDVKTDAVMFAALSASRVVHVGASEENPVEIECGGEGTGYSVAFDPLDGSSIIDCNFAVGSIVGVWHGRGLLGRKGDEQVCSMVCQYGPRVTVALALNNNSSSTSDGEIDVSGSSISATVKRPPSTRDNEKVAIELMMLPDGWSISIPKLSIRPNAKTFAPGNLRATSDNERYSALVSYWIENRYTLRYSGGLVPDVYHILVKGEGVLANASSPKAKAKLRLLFECAPIALIVEAAGGSSCVCPSEAGETVEPVSILQVVATDMDKRIGVCFGSLNEVERFISFIF